MRSLKFGIMLATLSLPPVSAIGVSLIAVSLSATASAQQATPLPLKRVRLYETGVGYFERTGPLAGGAAMELPIPSGHLDDALKSLVVMSNDGKASVDGIEFSSSVSRDMARALAGLPEEGGEGLSQVQLLRSLKSAAVVISSGADTHRGRIIDVVVPKPEAAPECVTVRKEGETHGTRTCRSRHGAMLLLLTDDGAIVRLRSNDIRSVKPTDPAWRARLTSAMDALSNADAQGARKLRVHGRGGKAVTLGYIAESPVWRSTYRLVLSNGADADDSLQGWALLHNDTDEDWKKVGVELVNGRPDSFLFPLAAPRYARRELVTPERDLSTVPQLMGRTVDNMWSGAGGFGLHGVGEGGGGRGEGIGLGSIGTIGHGAGSGSGRGAAQSSLLAVGNMANLAKAEGVESGALFRYKLPKPVDLRAHGSALLPFVNASVRSVQASYFAQAGEEGRSAVHFTNRTRQTMPAGPIAIFASGGFAGETALPRTKPGEQRILRFGYDQDTEINRSTSRSSESIRHLIYHRDGLQEHYMREQVVSYELVNRSAASRRLYLVLKVSSNGDVRGADDLILDELSSQPLAVFNIKGASRKMQDITIREGLVRRHELKRLGPNKLRRLASAPKLPSAQRTILLDAEKQLRQAQGHFVTASKSRQKLLQAKAEVKRRRASVRAVSNHSGEGEVLVERLVTAEQLVSTLQADVRRHDAAGEAASARGYKRLKALNKVSAVKAKAAPADASAAAASSRK